MAKKRSSTPDITPAPNENSWGDRLIRTGNANPAELRFHPQNPKIHPKGQTEALKGALGSLGWMGKPKVNLRTGDEWGEEQGVETVIDGHDRLKAAKEEGQTAVPVDYYDLSPQEEKLFLLTYDPIGQMAAHDRQLVDTLLQDVTTDDPRLMEMLAEFAEDQGLYFGNGNDEPPPPAEAKMDIADELQVKWGTARGQIWQLGEHRVMCGDVTNPDDVDLLMGEDVAQIAFTDPPWNVGYGDEGNQDHPSWNRRAIANDSLGEEFPAFAEDFCKAYHKYMAPGAAMYMVMSTQEMFTIDKALQKLGFHWSSTIIWAKDSMVLSRKDYHTQYEPIWYGWKTGAGRLMKIMDRTQTDLWHIPRPKVSAEYPTMKPIELVERALINSSRPTWTCIDFFAGSGSTLIACERARLKCRTMDIEPKFVAVTIERWADTTGNDPVLLIGEPAVSDEEE